MQSEIEAKFDKALAAKGIAALAPADKTAALRVFAYLESCRKLLREATHRDAPR